MAFDGDGLQDLFVSNFGSKSFLYRNPGGGRFDLRATNELVSASLPAMAFAWADYDNAGDLDVFVGMIDTSLPSRLYRNEGSGHFKNMSASEVGPSVQDWGHRGGVAWGDYDNDGFLDLFVANGLLNYVEKSFLYHNNGDGTFTRILDCTVAVDTGVAMGGHWVDHDQVGSLDLFVQEHGGDTAPLGCHRLYRNNGELNAWLIVKCVGTSSPRFGTGAKLCVKATIRGNPMWQLRLIDAGGTPWGGQSFEVQMSTDLVQWAPLTTITNLTGTLD
ncbi:MAG: FG-GAP repeat domain-containing protein [Verrucomicrobiia bacterium]